MKNISLKILAFVFASLMWFVVVNIDDPIISRTFYNIPVAVVNEEVLSESNKTYQIVDGTQTVSVIVKGKRRQINKIQTEDIWVSADMKELTLGTQIPIEVDIGMITDGIESMVSVPRNLQVKLEEEMTKKFPIVPAATGTPQEGYVLDSLVAVPEGVSLRGAQSVISRIKRVEAPVNISGLNKNTSIASGLVLYDEENNVIDQAKLTNNLGTEGITVNVLINPTKSVPLEFDTSEVKSAEGYNVTDILFEPLEVTITGTEEALAAVNSLSVPASGLKYPELKEKHEIMVDISMYLPEGIMLADENAGTVMVTIGVEKEGTKSFDINKGTIVAENLSENLSISYENVDVITVNVEGAQSVLDNFDIQRHVSIDLKQYTEEGTYKVPLKIQLPKGCNLVENAEVEIKLVKK